MRWFATVLFLTAQLVVVIYGFFDPQKYFGFFPFSASSDCKITAVIGDHRLSNWETLKRYHIQRYAKKAGRILPPAYRLLDIITTYETTYGLNDDAKVTMNCNVNGVQQPEWRYPSVELLH